VIVYLAQNRSSDATYGRDSGSMLERSLALLWQNYVNDHPTVGLAWEQEGGG
jgi:hypothetical protein